MLNWFPVRETNLTLIRYSLENYIIKWILFRLYQYSISSFIKNKF